MERGGPFCHHGVQRSGSSGNRVGNAWLESPDSGMYTGVSVHSMALEFGIMFGSQIQLCDKGGCRMDTRSTVFVRNPSCTVSLVIRRRASSLLFDAQKTVCGRSDRTHSRWYGRRTRRVRDLSSGATRAAIWKSRYDVCGVDVAANWNASGSISWRITLSIPNVFHITWVGAAGRGRSQPKKRTWTQRFRSKAP